MIITLLFAIGFAIFGYRDSWGNWTDKLLSTFVHFLLGSAIGLVFAMIASIFIPASEHKYEHIIVSMKDNSSVNGSFFLGSGTFKDEPTFSYYYEKDGYYKLENVPSENSKIYYTNVNNRVVCTYYTIDGFYQWLSIPIVKYSRSYEFYIPSGSIKTNFNLDAE